MKILVKRAFYGDEKGVKEGQVIDVSDARGKELISRNLAERYEDADSLHSSVSGLAMNLNTIVAGSLTDTSAYGILTDGLETVADEEKAPTPALTSEGGTSHPALSIIEPGESVLPATSGETSSEDIGSAHTSGAEAASLDEDGGLQVDANTNADGHAPEVAAKVKQTPKNKQVQTADNKS